MDTKEKQLAEAVLKHLCVGAQIGGVQFGPTPQVMLMDHTARLPPIQGRVSLSLASRWIVSDSAPLQLPESEEDLPELSMDEQLSIICSLREQRITEVMLGERHPHLLMRLDSGKVFLMNGRHEQYESWEIAGGTGVSNNDFWLVVACPAGGIAIWAPDSFPITAVYETEESESH